MNSLNKGSTKKKPKKTSFIPEWEGEVVAYIQIYSERTYITLSESETN